MHSQFPSNYSSVTSLKKTPGNPALFTLHLLLVIIKEINKRKYRLCIWQLSGFCDIKYILKNH